MTKQKKLYILMMTLCIMAALSPSGERYFPGLNSTWAMVVLFGMAILVSLLWRKERRKNERTS